MNNNKGSLYLWANVLFMKSQETIIKIHFSYLSFPPPKDVVSVRVHRVRLGLAGADWQGGGGCEGRHWPPGHHGENSSGPPAGHRLCRQDQGIFRFQWIFFIILCNSLQFVIIYIILGMGDNCAILDVTQRHLTGHSWTYLRDFWFSRKYPPHPNQKYFLQYFFQKYS